LDSCVVYLQGAPDVRVTGRRVVATIVDSIVFGLVVALLEAFGLHTSASGLSLTQLSGGGSGALVAFVIVYYTLMEGLLGKTVGKMVTGIRVVDATTGGLPGLFKAFVRTLLRFIDGLCGTYLLGFVIVLASPRRRRLGDMAANTQVIRG
jgi:uncharacterized RDD family membrane protein YckC